MNQKSSIYPNQMPSIQSISFIIRLVYLNFPGSTIPVLMFISRWIPVRMHLITAVELMKTAGPDLSTEWMSKLFDDPKISTRIHNAYSENAQRSLITTITPIDPGVKKIILHRTTSTLESNGIRPFLCFGSLLGFVRDGGFMSHDIDLDIGILYDETSCNKVKQVLEKNGFEIILYEPDPWPCRVIARITQIDKFPPLPISHYLLPTSQFIQIPRSKTGCAH